MNYYFVLILLTELIQFCSCELKSLKRQKVLSRKKRYLSFPEGSSIVLNLSFAKSYIWDYSPSPRPSWNNLFEADLGFKLPNNTRLFYGGKPPIKRRRSASEVHPLHRRERLELFRNIEGFLELFGVDGHPCVIKALCEAKERLKTGKSLVEDILHVLFTFPDGLGDLFEAEGYSKPASEEFCLSIGKRCPFSLLEYLLND